MQNLFNFPQQTSMDFGKLACWISYEIKNIFQGY